MATHPFLLFSKAAAPEKKANLPSAVVAKAASPSPERQKERLEQKFRDIAVGFEDLQPVLDGVEPERVIVFETIADTVTEFAKAAANVEGLDWVGDLDLGETAADDDFKFVGEEQKALPARLYAVMSNQKAIQELLSLWGKWQAEPEKQWTVKGLRGFGPFKDVFQHLKDIRRWGPRDRLDHTGVLAAWEENKKFDAEHMPKAPPVRFEVELWCRSDAAARQRAYGSLSALVSAAGGRCISQAAIPEIFYHGVLAELPLPSIVATLKSIQAEEYTDLIRCEEVMFFRPRAQSAFLLGQPATESLPRDHAQVPAVAASPVIAVLDGVPLRNHVLLRNKVQVDDPDDFAAKYEPGHQQHGTAMCSLVLNGDLSKGEAALSRPIYVRPILVPAKDWDGNYVSEHTPDDVLLIDLFHRAIRRIVASDGDQPAAAPTVKVVNLSFGNPWQPFDRHFSPLARLLDWLSWKYKLLFLVSAGNQGQDITIPVTADQWKALPPTELTNHVILAMRADQHQRRPFSPAESMNAVTVGAWHEDGCPPHTDRRVDLFKGCSLPSPFGTVAAGYDQSVKPEVYFPGGRQLFHGPVMEGAAPTVFKSSRGNNPPGLKVAAPGQSPMELNGTFYSRGTSDATALASRTVALAYERLVEYRKEPGWDRLTDDYIAVVLKALLVHGAAWGEEAALIEAAIPPKELQGSTGKKDWQKLQRVLNRFIGCGKVDPRKAQFATDERATVLAWDELREEKSHVYTLPMPPTLGSQKLWRRLTVTLAWLSPVNAQHRNYRKAMLWVDLGVTEKKTVEKEDGTTKKVTTETLSETLLRVQKAGLDEKSSQRGTIQHRVWEGEQAAVFDADARIQLRVSCRADAGKFADAVPYALAVSLEVKEGVNVPVYQEVKQLILVPVKPQAK